MSGVGAYFDSGSGFEEFLSQIQLLQYSQPLQSKLKIHKIEHLKYVTEEDLTEIGMSKPEQRRLIKSYQKQYPDSYLRKLKKKVLSRKASCSRTGSIESLPSQAASYSTQSGPKSISSPVGLPPNYPSGSEQHIIPASSITLCKQLGEGQFGTVHQGVWKVPGSGTKVQVAVKCVSEEKLVANPLDFLQEAAMMHRVAHEHIVCLYGVVLETKTVKLVSELAPLRSLDECLKEVPLRPSFPVLTLCDYAQQVCSGMAYLEAKRLIHRDLAARNLLVFAADRVKISDFGLSRALGVGEEYYRSNFSVNLKLPIAWCAPENINFLKFTSSSDVWSYAVTLWEMFTYGFQPWAGMTGHQILEAIDAPRSQRLEIPDACPQEYYSLMLQCWEHDPANRPKFADIITVLPEIKPERVQCICDCNDGQVDHLQYRMGDIITVLNKRPREYPDGYYWKGVLPCGRTGLFLPTSSVTYLGPDIPGGGGFIPPERPPTRSSVDQGGSSAKLSRSDSAASAFGTLRASFTKNKPRLKRDMISAPQGDTFRHTGHIGADGKCFGAVSSIPASTAGSVGDDTSLGSGMTSSMTGTYRDKLPKQIVAPFQMDSVSASLNGSFQSLTSLETLNTVIQRQPPASHPGRHTPLLTTASPARPPKPIAISPKFLSVSGSPGVHSPNSGSDNRVSVESRRISSTTSETAALIGPTSSTSTGPAGDLWDSLAGGHHFENPSCADREASLFDEVFEVFEHNKTSAAGGASEGAAGRSNREESLDSEPSPALFHSGNDDRVRLIKKGLKPDKPEKPPQPKAVVKPMTSSDAKLLDAVTQYAVKQAEKDLAQEAQRSRELIAALSGEDGLSVGAVGDEASQGSGASPSSSIASRVKRSFKLSRQNSDMKKSFTETINDNTNALHATMTSDAEAAYKSLVEAKHCQEQPMDTAPSSTESARRANSISVKSGKSLVTINRGSESKVEPEVCEGSSGIGQSAVDRQEELVEQERKRSVSDAVAAYERHVMVETVRAGKLGNTSDWGQGSAVDMDGEGEEDGSGSNPLRLLQQGGGAAIVRSFRGGSGRRTTPPKLLSPVKNGSSIINNNINVSDNTVKLDDFNLSNGESSKKIVSQRLPVGGGTISPDVMNNNNTDGRFDDSPSFANELDNQFFGKSAFGLSDRFANNIPETNLMVGDNPLPLAPRSRGSLAPSSQVVPSHHVTNRAIPGSPAPPVPPKPKRQSKPVSKQTGVNGGSGLIDAKPLVGPTAPSNAVPSTAIDKTNPSLPLSNIASHESNNRSIRSSCPTSSVLPHKGNNANGSVKAPNKNCSTAKSILPMIPLPAQPVIFKKATTPANCGGGPASARRSFGESEPDGSGVVENGGLRKCPALVKSTSSNSSSSGGSRPTTPSPVLSGNGRLRLARRENMGVSSAREVTMANTTSPCMTSTSLSSLIAQLDEMIKL